MIALWKFITKRGDYIWIGDFVDRGRFCIVLELWSFRLYLGASLCLFLAQDVFIFYVFIFYELYMIGGDIIFLFLLLVSHCATLIYIYEIIHDIYLLLYVM